MLKVIERGVGNAPPTKDSMVTARALRAAAKVLGRSKVRNNALERQLRDLRRAIKAKEYQHKVLHRTRNGRKVEVWVEAENQFLTLEDLRQAKRQIKRQLRELLTEYKGPTTNDNYVGIEIELISPRSRSNIIDDLLDLELESYVTVQDDGSIIVPNSDACCDDQECGCRDNDAGHPHELCVLVKQTEVSEVLTKLCNYLNRSGCFVNTSCGLHVHLDMRGRVVADAYSNLVAAQDIFFRMQPKSRQQSEYCERVEDRAWAARSGSRYRAINAQSMSEHNTLEVRLHAGTINANKIINWVNLLVHVVEGERIPRRTSNLETFATHFKLPTELSLYVQSRIDKFAPMLAEFEAERARHNDEGRVYHIPTPGELVDEAMDASLSGDQELSEVA